MKQLTFITYAISTCVLMTMFALVGCGNDDDDGPSATEVLLSELSSKEWTLEKVTRDNDDVTSEFAGFTFTFTGDDKYETENGGLAWADSGTLTLNEGSLDTFTRDDDISVMVTVQDGNALTLAFTISENVYEGRASRLKGGYVFELE